MTRSILLASHNPDKLEEITRALEAAPGIILRPADIAASRAEPIPDPVEDGSTYEENAAIKAHEYSRWAGMPAIADDTGLEVAALDGAPGLYTARFAGPSATYRDNVEKMLRELRGVSGREARAARFVSVIVLSDGDNISYSVTGICDGSITEEPRGTDGFGYDPIFLPTGEELTFAEMDGAAKDRISHRGRALAALAADAASGRFPIPLS